MRCRTSKRRPWVLGSSSSSVVMRVLLEWVRICDSQDRAGLLDRVSLPWLRTLIEELHEFMILAHQVNLSLELLIPLDQGDGLSETGSRLLGGPALAVSSGNL